MPPLDSDLMQEIFHKAVELPESEREAFIVKACDSNPDFERELRELLAARNFPGGVLEDPVIRLDFVPDNLVGTTIGGRYRVERELSYTAMSQVYLASDSRLQNRPVIIKILSRVLVQDGNARQRFKKEVVALLRINHPHVVNVLDTGKLVDERPYIVMSYVQGETLRTQIRTGGMDLERAASILQQIGVALDHCHEQNVFHRDLKPENIMIKDGTDSVVLIDFGIAKVKESGTTVTGVSAGTLPYMAPEQLHGEEITAASDVYSIAVIAYEMVTGVRPFNPTTPSQLADMQRARVRVRPRDLRPDLPPKAQAVILRGLSFKRQSRYQSAGQFCNELAAALKKNDAHIPIVEPRLKYLIIALALAVISFGVYKYIIRDGKLPPNRSFSYFLTVQPAGDGQAPYKSSGDETYGKGDKFQLTVSTPVPAFLYIFNERPAQLAEDGFTMVFPTNHGSASIGANQSVQSKWFTFSGAEGAENFWLVWSTSPVSELDSATSEAAKRPDGALTGQTLVTVKQYLIARKAEIDATTYNYNANKTAVVRARRDLLVTLAQFKHR
jgi:serine/threonine protein kinase